MLHSELKIGMKVKANKESNSKYVVTKEFYGCEGVVTDIQGKCFWLKVTEHQNKEYIDKNYEVEAQYFDLVTDKMQVELKEVNVGLDFDYGDLLVSDKGRCALVVSDFDNSDYVAVLLDTNKITDVCLFKGELIEELEEKEDFGKVIRVIKASNLKLSEI